MTTSTAQTLRNANDALGVKTTPDGQSLIDQCLDKTQRELAGNLKRTAGLYASAIDQAADHLEKSMLISIGITKLRAILSDKVMTEYVIPLMNSPLGFLTDRNPKAKKPRDAYDVETVRECVITALLAGLRYVGNEFNIIADRMMPVQAGWRRKVLEHPGVAEAEFIPGTSPKCEGGLAKIRIGCRAVMSDGRVVELHDAAGQPGRVIAIGQREGDSLATWNGKAERRAWMALYHLLTGQRPGLLPAEDPETSEEGTGDDKPPLTKPLTRTEELAAKLTGGVASGEQQARVTQLMKRLGLSIEEQQAYLAGYGGELAKLTPDQAEELCRRLEADVADLPGTMQEPNPVRSAEAGSRKRRSDSV